MKKLFLGLSLVLSQFCNAETVATARNSGGGLIVLTDVSCTKESGFVAYSNHPSARTQFGCWWSDSTMVHITWSDGDFRSYELSGWTVNTEVANRMRRKEKQNL